MGLFRATVAAGALIALASLAVIVLVIYQTWFERNLAQSTGIILLVILARLSMGGVVVFG